MSKHEAIIRAGHEAARKAIVKENDGLVMFQALETQDELFTTDGSEILVDGSNRAGKTIALAVRFAAILRDMPVRLSDGRLYEVRMPHQKNRALIMWVVGKMWSHVGNTIWRVLFKRGLYKIIRDERTGRWRAFHPVKDAARKHETKPSYPLIPLAEVVNGLSGIAWEDKKLKAFKSFQHINGTMVNAYASTGEVEEGVPVDEIWVDEKLENPGHYGEYLMRLLDNKGRISWSSLCRADPKLMEVSRRAAEQKREVERGERTKAECVEIRLRLMANPFIDQEEKQKAVDRLPGDERIWRIDGEFFVGNLMIYPTFNRNIHRAIFSSPEGEDAISAILRERNGQPPDDWTRELVLDPGTTKPAVMLCAIPPSVTTFRGKDVALWMNDEPYLIVYDEIYMARLTAAELAEKVLTKTKGYQFERFIIDGKAAAQTPMGYAGTIGGNYSKEFEKRGLRCRQTGSQWMYGDPNFVTGQQMVDAALAIRPCGTPRLRIVIEHCPELVLQMEGNLRAVERGLDGNEIIQDKPAKGQKDDLRRTLEYWCSRSPQYVPVTRFEPEMTRGERVWRDLQARGKKHREPGTINIGPGRAA